MRINYRTLLITAVAVSISVLSFIFGCIEAENEEEVEKVFKLGVLGPFSGRTAGIGEEFKGAVEIAFDSIDYQLDEYRVEIAWIDSKSDAERATLAYEKAISEEGIDACILNWHSAVAVAAMDVAARNQVPHFFGLGGSDVVNEKFAYDLDYYSYYICKGWPVPDKLTNAYIETLEYAIETGGWAPRNRKVAIYGEDSDWGRSFSRAIMEDFETAGWEIAGEEYFPTGDTELVHLVKRINDLDTAVIAGSVATAPSFAAFISEVRKLNMQSLIIGDGFGWIGEWHQITGDDSNYILDQVPAWTTDEGKQFVKEFEERYGFTPSTSAGGIAYDKTLFFIKIAKNVLQEYGELSSSAIYKYSIENLWSGNISFTSGIIMEEYKYSPESIPDPVVGEGYFIFPVVQYYHGQMNIVWPEVWKEADFITPSYITGNYRDDDQED